MKMPEAPSLKFAFQIEAECAAPITGGAGVLGERRHIQITGGKVFGPELSGTILPGGSDWALYRPDGVVEVSAHYSIMSDDGIPVYVRNRGLRVASKEVIARLLSGAPVDPGEYYFRSTPVFDAPLGRLQHLNDRVFTAVCERHGNTTVIKVFEVT